MRITKVITTFIILIIIQCFVESTIYETFLFYSERRNFFLLPEFIIRFSVALFLMSVFPILILMILQFIVFKRKSTVMHFSLYNLVSNFIVMAFYFFYLEPILFDINIFITSIITAFIILLSANFYNKFSDASI